MNRISRAIEIHAVYLRLSFFSFRIVKNFLNRLLELYSRLNEASSDYFSYFYLVKSTFLPRRPFPILSSFISENKGILGVAFLRLLRVFAANFSAWNKYQGMFYVEEKRVFIPPLTML